MRHVLYIMIGMPSAYHSGIEFCTRLKRAGMQTTIACNLDVSSLVHEHGIDFHHLSEGAQRRESFAHDLKALNGLPQPRRLWRTLLCGRRHRQASFASDELDLLIETVAPDVLAIDMECHYAIVATRRWKLPTVLCSRWFDSFRSAGYPPLHSQRLPSDSGLGKWLIHAEWFALRLRRGLRDLTTCLSRRTFKPLDYRSFSASDLRALARHHGIAHRQLFKTDDWLIPHGYHNLPVLSFTASEIDFPHTVDANLHYAGPMVSAAGKTFDLGSEHLDSWLELQAAKGRRLIYCAFGTWLRSEVTLLNEVLAMAARRDDLAVVMGLGGLEPTAAPEPQSENTLLLDSAPQMQLLERADAAILHAGIASLNEALLNRTPLVVISVETNDQNGCAERVRWHRLGHVLDRNTASSRTIEHAVDAVLKDDALRERLDNIAGIIKRYDAENIAASSFERALASVDQKRSFSLSIPQT